MINSNFRKNITDSWFSYLQIQICKEFEFLESNKCKFIRRDWNKKKNEKVEELLTFYQVEKFLIMWA